VAHKYEFPGGKIEAGESGESAVARELKEELDLEVKVGGLYAKHTFEYPDFIITLSLYECEMLSKFVLKEHESYAWIAPKDLKEEEWAPADADVLGSLKRVFGE
jgi:8-oxo-dGTP diphosphatase